MPGEYNFDLPGERERMQSDYGVKYDEQGRAYTQTPGQPWNYISPVAFGEQRPEDTTGIFRQRPQWDNKSGKWETPIDWGNILNIATAAALTGGVAHAAGAFGGAGGAGGAMQGPQWAANATPAGGLPSASLPAAWTGGLPPASPSVWGGGYGPATEIARRAANGANPASGPSGSGGEDGGNLFGIPDWLKDALGIGIAGAGLLKGGARNNIPNPYTPPAGGAGAPAASGPNVGQQGLEGILGMARGRADQSEPLFKALQAMALGGLPDYAKGQGNG